LDFDSDTDFDIIDTEIFFDTVTEGRYEKDIFDYGCVSLGWNISVVCGG